MIEATDRYYREQNANIHRGVYALSQRATEAYERARVTIQKFINAAHSHGDYFYAAGRPRALTWWRAVMGGQTLKAGDEMIISGMEHHSNIVPWQMICEETGAVLRPIAVE